MEQIFNFGKIDFYGTGAARNSVVVTASYKEKKPGQKVFSASGEIFNARRSDILCGGQCLDTIAEYITHPVFREIYRLWKLYHLNDMHPECEHQEAMGWREAAKEIITVYKFTLTMDAIKGQNAAKRRILEDAQSGQTVQATPDERLFLGLSYSLDSPDEELPEMLAPFYKQDGTERRSRGFVDYRKEVRGLLGRPCPVCGYRYGTAWQYRPIPARDEAIIIKLLTTGAL